MQSEEALMPVQVQDAVLDQLGLTDGRTDGLGRVPLRRRGNKIFEPDQ